MNQTMNQSRKESGNSRVSIGLFLMQVMWPAFLGAALTTGLFFSMVDPLELNVVHQKLHQSRELAYTVGFIMFWSLICICCSITWYLAASEK